MLLQLSFYSLLFFTITSSSLSNQRNYRLDTKNNDYCDYMTDGKGLSKGIKLKLLYPCSWKLEDSRRENIVKVISNDSENLHISLFIDYHKKGIIYSVDYMRESFEKLGHVTSNRLTKIDVVPAIETIVEYSAERPAAVVYMKCLFYSFKYKNRDISIAFSSTRFNRNDADHDFDENENLFKVLASEVVLQNDEL